MTDERLKREIIILNKNLKENRFKFLGFNTNNPYLVVAQKTTKYGRIYTIKIDLTPFPHAVPPAFITDPKPLLTRSGGSMLGASHDMHTLGGENGCVRVCHYHPNEWDANVSLYKVVMKIRVWLETYEKHLETGELLSHYLQG